MIRYMGSKKLVDGTVMYSFLINGQQKEIKESSLKQHPGCYEVLPPDAKARISDNKKWASRL